MTPRRLSSRWFGSEVEEVWEHESLSSGWVRDALKQGVGGKVVQVVSEVERGREKEGVGWWGGGCFSCVIPDSSLRLACFDGTDVEYGGASVGTR